MSREQHFYLQVRRFEAISYKINSSLHLATKNVPLRRLIASQFRKHHPEFQTHDIVVEEY